MKTIYFLKNKVFRKDSLDNCILNRTGKKIYRRDVGYSVAEAIKEKLGRKVIITDDFTKLENMNSLAINWGNSHGQDPFLNIFNAPFSIKNCVRKDRTYSILDLYGVPVPNFTKNKEIAFDYINQGGCVVRHVINGKGGDGVEVVTDFSIYKTIFDFPDAPLYTKLFPKTHEVRVHVFADEILQIVEKKKMGKEKLMDNDLQKINPHVRNHDNGWVMVKNNINPILLESKLVKETAVRSIKALNLLFGAVDLMVSLDPIFDQVYECAVTEVNTAPGIEGSTLELYSDRMASFINNY